MSEFILIAAVTLVVFGLFIGVLALKEKRAASRPPIHTCANRGGCQCSNQGRPDPAASGRKRCSHEHSS